MRCCYEDDPFNPLNYFRQRRNCFPAAFCKRKGEGDQLLNPGTIRNIHWNAFNIMPIWIDGAQATVGQSLGISQGLFATWTLSHVLPTGFRVGASYQRPTSSTTLSTPFIEAEINPKSCSTNLRFVQNLKQNVLLEGAIQMKPWSVVKSIISLEHIGKDKTMSITFYDAKSDKGTVTIAPLYKVSKFWSLGSELMYHWDNGKNEFQVAGVAKYANKNTVVASTYSCKAIDLSFWHRVNKSWQIGSTLGLDPSRDGYRTSMFYQWECKDVQVRGLFDTDCTVGFTYMRYLPPVPATFTISLLYCVPTNKFSCGFKFDLNSNLL